MFSIALMLGYKNKNEKLQVHHKMVVKGLQKSNLQWQYVYQNLMSLARSFFIWKISKSAHKPPFWPYGVSGRQIVTLLCDKTIVCLTNVLYLYYALPPRYS